MLGPLPLLLSFDDPEPHAARISVCLAVLRASEPRRRGVRIAYVPGPCSYLARDFFKASLVKLIQESTMEGVSSI